MKELQFTDNEVSMLKNMLDSYINYMIHSGVSEDYIEVRACRAIISKLEE